MELKASGKHLRVSPFKIRPIVNLIRGRLVGEAVHILRGVEKANKKYVEMVLNSAIANAKDLTNVSEMEDLYIKTAFVDEGRIMKRMMPRARGRADRILKRSSHITIILAEIPADRRENIGTKS